MPAGAEVWPALALQLGWLDASHPAVERLAAAPGALRSATARGVGACLRRLAEQGPWALVLDDAHAADDVVLDALEYATLSGTHGKLWIAALARPSLLTAARPTPWAARAARAARHTLEPLPSDAAQALLRRLLLPVESVSAQALAILIERTQGIPGQMVELVHGLKREGVVRRVPGGTGYFLDTDALAHLPNLPVIEWAAEAELTRLPEDLRHMAAVCAALSDPFTLPELDAVVQRLELGPDLGQPWLEPRVALERLRDARILRVRVGACAFVSPLLAALLYQRTPPELRAKIHRDALAVTPSLPLGERERLARNARHARGAGDVDRAIAASLELGDWLAARQEYLQAGRAYAKALQVLANTRDLRFVRAAQGLGLAHLRLNRLAEAAETLATAQGVAHSPIPTVCIRPNAPAHDRIRRRGRR